MKAALEGEMQVDEEDSSILPKSVSIRSKLDKGKKSKEKNKSDPEMQLEGNTKQNKLRKKQFKKDKKKRARNEKQAVGLASIFENVTLSAFQQQNLESFKENFI